MSRERVNRKWLGERLAHVAALQKALNKTPTCTYLLAALKCQKISIALALRQQYKKAAEWRATMGHDFAFSEQDDETTARKTTVEQDAATQIRACLNNLINSVEQQAFDAAAAEAEAKAAAAAAERQAEAVIRARVYDLIGAVEELAEKEAKAEAAAQRRVEREARKLAARAEADRKKVARLEQEVEREQEALFALHRKRAKNIRRMYIATLEARARSAHPNGQLMCECGCGCTTLNGKPLELCLMEVDHITGLADGGKLDPGPDKLQLITVVCHIHKTVAEARSRALQRLLKRRDQRIIRKPTRVTRARGAARATRGAPRARD